MKRKRVNQLNEKWRVINFMGKPIPKYFTTKNEAISFVRASSCYDESFHIDEEDRLIHYRGRNES